MSNKSINLIVCRPMDPVLSRPLPPVPGPISPSNTTGYHDNPNNSPPPPSSLPGPSELTGGIKTLPRLSIGGVSSNHNAGLFCSGGGGDPPMAETMSTSMKLSARRSSDMTGVEMSGHRTVGGKTVNNNSENFLKIKRDPVSIDDLQTISSRSVSPSMQHLQTPSTTTTTNSPLTPPSKNGGSNGGNDPSSASSTALEMKSILRQGSNNPANSLAINLDIHSRLQYLGHLRKVNFSRYSPRLEYSGGVNLIEGGTRLPADLFLFPDVLLIGQREPDGFVTIIKEPIYNNKITYINIPTCSQNELILQYINESGKKQFAHFHGPTVNDWLVRIQSHMLYNCHWWMNNIA